MSSGKDSYYYDSYGRVHRRNPQDVDPYSYSGSSMSTQGRRTVLPPLTSVFPPTSPSSAAAYPAYPQQRSSHDVGYGQYDPYAASAQQQMQQPYAYPFYTQQAVDARYPGQTPQQSYPRTSPPISSDPRRLPPLSVPQPTDRYQGVPYYPQSHSDPTLISPASDVRSPQASYSYQQYQSIPSSIHPPTTSGSSSSRPAAHPAATGVHHHSSMHVGHGMGVERTLSRHITQMPYARQAVAAVPEYEPRLEPTIKKKRKRADARQLEVLNATYARTAFPSTEERASLAKQLDMTARSVQIWFQNKRQSMRQGSGRSAAGASTSSGQSAVASTTPAPAPAPSPPVPAVASASAAAGSAAARYGHRTSSPVAYSTRSPPPVAYPSRTPQPGAYSSRSPPPGAGRSGQSPPSHVSRGRDVDPRDQWPSRGY